MPSSESTPAGSRTEENAAGASRRSTVVGAVAVCVATALSSELCHALRYPGTDSAIVYPAYAVLTAALLLTAPRRWWIWILASAVGRIDVFHGIAPSFLLATEVANATRAILAAVVLRRLRKDAIRFDTLEGTVIFLLVAGLIAPVVGAFCGASLATAFPRSVDGPHSYWAIWEAWLFSNSLVGITLLPLILIVARNARAWRGITAARTAEISLLGVGLFVALFTAHVGGSSAVPQPVRLVGALPFLLWAAARFGPGLTSACAVVVAAAAIAGIMSGTGPIVPNAGDDPALSLFVFVAFRAVPSLLLAVLVTERERVMAALREGQQRYLLATTAGSVGVWDWALQTNTLDADPVLKNIIGYSEPEIRNTLDDWLRRIHPADVDRTVARAAACVEGRTEAYEAEYRMIHKDGAIRWFFSRGARVRESDGITVRLVGTTTDITERKRAELELQERRRELAHLGRVATLGQLAGALAHELRQPLTAILTNAETARHFLSKKAPDLNELRAIMNEIVADDTRANEVIVRLRGLLKKGEGAQEALSLRSVVQDALDITHGDLIARAVGVTCQFESSLPFVRGDRVELQQVLVNLLINGCEAMEHRPPGDRALTVGTALSAEGLPVAFVTDRGSGLPEGDPDRVFEPFVTTKREGLGLGLAICRTIVDAHGGRIWAMNNFDVGATFFLALPAQAAA